MRLSRPKGICRCLCHTAVSGDGQPKPVPAGAWFCESCKTEMREAVGPIWELPPELVIRKDQRGVRARQLEGYITAGRR